MWLMMPSTPMFMHLWTQPHSSDMNPTMTTKPWRSSLLRAAVIKAAMANRIHLMHCCGVEPGKGSDRGNHHLALGARAGQASVQRLRLTVCDLHFCSRAAARI